MTEVFFTKILSAPLFHGKIEYMIVMAYFKANKIQAPSLSGES
jgi:hypothetical protein